MPPISPRTFRGTRDFLPSELLARRRIVETIEEAFRRYGFQPLETPAIEYLEILTGKSEENDKLIYEIKRARGEEQETAESAIALRYDLTVPLARVVAQYADLPRPFKRYQIQPVWRADRPQPRQGRFREFVQCDADIVGTDSLLADAEIIALTYEVLKDLGFENYSVIRLSSRKFLHGLAQIMGVAEEQFLTFCRALDKVDKIGWKAVADELIAHEIDPEKVARPLNRLRQSLQRESHDFPDAYRSVGLNRDANDGLQEIESVHRTAVELGVPSTFIWCDPALARGLDYYTGPIFESLIPGMPHIGSLSGGGRYDGLVQTFSKERVPATGTTLGLDRIQTALTQLGKFESVSSTTQVLVARFDADGMADCLKIAAELRKRRMSESGEPEPGLRVEVWYDDDKLKKQFAYADKQGIPLVIVAGPDERSRNAVALKNMKTGEQKEIRRENLVETIKAMLPRGPNR